MVTFLKFTHRRMSPAEFRALEAVRHLRALANGLTPDARSKEPKEATFQNLPEHEELLRSVLAYCHKQPDKPQCITQVLLGMVLGPCAMTCGLPWSAILGRVGVPPLVSTTGCGGTIPRDGVSEYPDATNTEQTMGEDAPGW
jgi:hypothetical protein